MTGDYLEKYARINLDWPALAGTLEQQITAQRRLIIRLSRLKHSNDVKELLISVASSIEASENILKWVQKVLVDVGKDSEALMEGSIVRNQLRWNSQLLDELLNSKNAQTERTIREAIARRDNQDSTQH